MLCAGRRVAWAKLGLNSRDTIEMTCLLLSCRSLAVLFPHSDLSAACLGSCSASPLFSRWAQRWLGAFCRDGCCHAGCCSSYMVLYTNPMLRTLLLCIQSIHIHLILCTCLQYVWCVQLYILMNVLERKVYFSSVKESSELMICRQVFRSLLDLPPDSGHLRNHLSFVAGQFEIQKPAWKEKMR